MSSGAAKNVGKAMGPPGDGGPAKKSDEVREQDRFLPIANISRIMKKSLPPNAKIASYLQPLQLFMDFTKLLLVLMMTVMTVIMWDALLAHNIYPWRNTTQRILLPHLSVIVV